ncbi:uncharacterized protein LOC141633978 [Silene latifolia]|uniref:uncharacterized protein LOC141633978 n=1 Tax=Silene latifolia TaxID=37657 RepID=UPI003D76CF7A
MGYPKIKSRGGLKRVGTRNNDSDEECRAKNVRSKTGEDPILHKKPNNTEDLLGDDEVDTSLTIENMSEDEYEDEEEDENGDEDCDGEGDSSNDEEEGKSESGEDGDSVYESEGEEEDDGVDESKGEEVGDGVDGNEDAASKEIAPSNKTPARRNKSRGKRGIPMEIGSSEVNVFPKSLRTRVCIAKFQNFMKRLSPEQREAVNEIGFGCLLELDITQICGDLGIWLVRNINPYSLTLTLAPNSSFRITEVDVYLALKLSCGPKYVEEAKDRGNDEVVEEAIINWKKRWGVRKGVTAPVTTTMPDKILTHGHGDNFKVDFVIYTCSNLLYGDQARHCNYKLLMALLEPSQICNFNWCEYVIRALVKVRKEFRKNPSILHGPLIVVTLLYLDRVEFESSTVERKFPILLGWDDKKVTERKNNELRAGGYGQGCVVPPMNLNKLYQLGYVPQQDFIRLKQILMNLPRLYNQREGGPSVDIDAIPRSTDVGEREGR